MQVRLGWRIAAGGTSSGSGWAALRAEHQASLPSAPAMSCVPVSQGSARRPTAYRHRAAAGVAIAPLSQRQNEEMQQMKPAFSSDSAGFTADLRCSADF